MNKQKIIFRADGNSEMGLGHISRCCAFADMLRKDFDISFYTRSNSKPVIEDIKRYCDGVFEMNNHTSYDEEPAEWISVLKGTEIVILDGYNFKTGYQQKIKEKGCKLICVDDIHAYHFVADAVINHAPGINKEEYSCESYTQLFLGTEYVLLKKPFLEEASKQHKPLNQQESHILVCLGGADPDNITQKVLEKLIHSFPSKKIDVVTGAANKHSDGLRTFTQLINHVIIHQNVQPNGMLKLMQQSHIAVTSASTIALEYCCVKGVLFLKLIAENQKEIYNALIEKKCAFAFEKLKEQFQTDNIIMNQNNLIDGKSNQRLLKIINALSKN